MLACISRTRGRGYEQPQNDGDDANTRKSTYRIIRLNQYEREIRVRKASGVKADIDSDVFE